MRANRLHGAMTRPGRFWSGEVETPQLACRIEDGPSGGLLSGTAQGTMLVTPAVYVLGPRYLRRTNENPLGAELADWCCMPTALLREGAAVVIQISSRQAPTLVTGSPKSSHTAQVGVICSHPARSLAHPECIQLIILSYLISLIRFLASPKRRTLLDLGIIAINSRRKLLTAAIAKVSSREDGSSHPSEGIEMAPCKIACGFDQPKSSACQYALSSARHSLAMLVLARTPMVWSIL